jgi:amidase
LHTAYAPVWRKIQVDEMSLSPYFTALQMLQALRNRTLSARELLDLHLRRISRHDGKLNSIVVKDLERAYRDADAADHSRAIGEDRPLLGLPMTVKESIDVRGLATTAGVAFRANHRAERDALTVRRLRDAGAVIIGKTNVCPWLADYIGDNPIYGRTNNPWDITRTSGGSTAGSAALAAGLIPLELGSDLGGSIRVPAAFCGLWGHKPSEGLIPNSGNFPGSSLPNPGAVLAAQGPHGRSAADLALCVSVLAGPDVGADAAWKVHPPSPRQARLADFRVAVLDPPAWVPLDPEIRAALSGFADRLGNICASVSANDLAGVMDMREYFHLFRSLMNALTSIGKTPEQRQNLIDQKLATGDPVDAADAKGVAGSAQDYLLWLGKREEYRAAWRTFFTRFDVLITPMTLIPAFPHPTIPPSQRRLEIDGRQCGFD